MDSFDAEWSQIKQEAVAGGLVSRLASADDGSKGGAGDVVSTPVAWRDAAAGVETLAGNAKKALSALLLLQGGLGGLKSTGVERVGAQGALYNSWNDYVSRVQARTSALQGQFSLAGQVQHQGDGRAKSVLESGGGDKRIASGIGALDDGQGDKDTPQLGGGPDYLDT